MSSLEKINSALSKLVKFIEPLHPLVRCHMVDYLTANHWENLLPPKVREDLLALPQEKLYLIPTGAILGHDGEIFPSVENTGLWNTDLITLVAGVRAHSLGSFGVTSTLQQVLETYGSQEIQTFSMTGIMSEKKMHEVEVMSQVIARLSQGFGVDWILDLGSGKGYLSSSLVLQYSLSVLALDSSPINITSAQTRNLKLEKRLEKMKASEINKPEGEVRKKGRRSSKKQVEEVTPLPENMRTNIFPSVDGQGCYIGLTKFIRDDTDLMQILKDSIKSEVDKQSNAQTTSDIAGKIIPHMSDSNEGCKNNIRSQDSLLKKCADSYKRDTIHNDELKNNKFPKIDLRNESLGLVGLHTCGNLAATSLRLFLSNSKVKFLCNVGCCYHLIEEEFCKNHYSEKPHNAVPQNVQVTHDSSRIPEQADSSNDVSLDPLHPQGIPNIGVGFPLCSFLRQRKVSLERNPRMLSSQPIDRLSNQSSSNFDSLYWRSLLQQLLHERLGSHLEIGQVGRIAAKCRNFTEYVRKALAKLQLTIEITDEELHAYDKKHEGNKMKLERFFVLRSSMAPLIEGLILLDRLAFLYEQESIEAAYLVQLFDPVTSPRCYGVIGVKKS